MNPYSCTSNTVKLFKHLDRLKGIQEGKVAPIMLHTAPTHKCQLSCAHCCFANREDKGLDLSFDSWLTAITQFRQLGTKALEFTGGGDPLLWPYINQAIDVAAEQGYHIGLITNGLAVNRVRNWRLLDWVRVSLNTLEYRDDLDIRPLIGATNITFCYIYHAGSKEHLGKVVEFANRHKRPCRITVDCISEGSAIDGMVEEAKRALKEFRGNDYVFLSDFNIDTTSKPLWDCRLHMIKPFLYTDGYVYSCPSAELATENNRSLDKSLRVCRYDEVLDFYRSYSAQTPKERTCSYCKYVPQQNVLEQVLTHTTCNEFV